MCAEAAPCAVASSTAPRRGSDVLLTTLDHPGAGVARDGGGEQWEYAYYVFQDSCMRAICKEPLVITFFAEVWALRYTQLHSLRIYVEA